MTKMFLPLDPADPSEPTTSATLPHLSKDADGIPHGFRLHTDGVWLDPETKDGNVVPIRLCSPLRVTAICRRMDGSAWGRLVEVMDPDGRWHEVTIDASEIAGSEVRLLKPLLSLGLSLGRGRDIRKSVCELIEDWKPGRRVILTDTVGWVDKECTGFALGTGSVIGTDEVMLTGMTRDMSGALGTKGSLEDWQRDVAGPCCGNPIAMLALCQAFVGPLLKPLGMESGGFHLVGASSCGKSTLIRVAVSVWGAPDMKYSWRTTDNALEPMAAARCDMLMALDEIAEIDGAKLGDAIYMLGNGQGKGRMSTDGRRPPRFRWHVAMLSSGEIDVASHIVSGGKKTRAGHGVRLVDVIADDGRHGAFEDLHGAATSSEFAEALGDASAEFFGNAGPAFVEAIMSKPMAIVSAKRIVERFC